MSEDDSLLSSNSESPTTAFASELRLRGACAMRGLTPVSRLVAEEESPAPLVPSSLAPALVGAPPVGMAAAEAACSCALYSWKTHSGTVPPFIE
eukprot:5735221-Pleurochrysis_carterae.AAC.2